MLNWLRNIFAPDEAHYPVNPDSVPVQALPGCVRNFDLTPEQRSARTAKGNATRAANRVASGK